MVAPARHRLPYNPEIDIQTGVLPTEEENILNHINIPIRESKKKYIYDSKHYQGKTPTPSMDRNPIVLEQRA